MKKAIIILLVTVLAAAACAQDKNCPGCGADVKSIYSGGVVGGASNSSGPGLSIDKSAPAEMIKGDVLTVSIDVANGLSSDETVTLKETFGGAEPVDMGGFTRTMPQITSAPPYYKMVLTLGPGEKKILTYKIKPLYYGKYKIPGTEASTSTEKTKSDAVNVNVKCNADGTCETELDENALTCPQDCKPDQKDKLCDPLADGICDPDCTSGEDPDCVNVTTSTQAAGTTMPPLSCGNGLCEPDKKETGANCPADCKSGAPNASPTSTGLVLVFIFILAVIALAVYGRRWLKKR